MLVRSRVSLPQSTACWSPRKVSLRWKRSGPSSIALLLARKFIDTAEFTITQRRDSSIVDKELTRRYGGVTTYKDIIVIDTLGFVPVKDSLFKNSDRYKTMINLPEDAGEPGSKFKMEAGFVERNNVKVPVFEIKVDKDVVLYDQDKDLITQEKEVVSVDGVNGPSLKVGSMDEVNTNGNWPKVYGSNDE